MTRCVSLTKTFLPFIFLAISALLKGQSDFTIVNKWDLENASVGAFTSSQAKALFPECEISNYGRDTKIAIDDNGSKVIDIALYANEGGNGLQLSSYYNQNHTGYEEIYMSYNIKFDEDWQWTGGGKLSGIIGMPDFDIPLQDDQGFWYAPNFKQGGKLTTYHYDRTRTTVPWAEDTYNINKVYFNNGNWYNVTQRVVRNSFTNGNPNSDGIEEIWIDGILLYQRNNLKTLASQNIKIDAFFIGVFYGNSSAGDYYRPTRNTHVYIDNIAIWQPKSDGTFGNRTLHNTGQILQTPFPINDRTFRCDKKIVPEDGQVIKNENYGATYGNLLEESYLIDAGENNTVTLNLNDYDIARNDYLHVYDGNQTNAKFMDLIENTYGSNKTYTSKGRYMFVRFVTDAEGGADGWKGTIQINESVTQGDGDPGDEDPDSTVYANNKPQIENQTFTINENNFANNFIGLIQAEDQDEGQKLTFAITQGNNDGLFVLNSSTGQIYTNSVDPFGAETIVREITVKVTDDGEIAESNSASIIVSFIPKPVEIVNNAPTIDNQVFLVKENEFKNNYVGKIIAFDIDETQQLSYSIVTGNESSLFSLNSSTGELTTTKSDLFGPGKNTKKLTVEVRDDAAEEKSATAIVEVNFVGNSKMVYIDPSKADNADENGSLQHPYNSWEDIVWTEGNSYLQKKGTTANVEKITITANNVSIGSYGNGKMPVIVSSTNSYVISGYDKINITISNISIKAENAVSCIYFLGTNNDNIVIERCKFESNANAIRVIDGKKIVVRYNSFIGGTEGIYATTENNEIYYNIFKNVGTAVNVMSKLSVARVFNNVFINNNQSVSVSYADLTLYNNIFYLPQANQVAIRKETNKLVSDHNIYYPEQTGFVQVQGVKYNKLDNLQKELKVDMNSFNSDPLFVDMFTDNFEINSFSPAINAGINLNIDKDFFGNNIEMTPEIGIAEYKGITSINDEPVLETLMNIYPNPSSGQFKVRIDLSGENKENSYQNTNEINIINTSGQTVYNKKLSSTEDSFDETINLEGISNGLYFVLLKLADKVITEKLILNR